MSARPPSLWSDTHPEVERRIVDGYRRMDSVEKLQRMVELTRGVQQLALARLEAEYPNDSLRQRQLRLAALWIDDALMVRAFGWDPQVEGR